ncbi:MAG: aminotransferase class V-fold PLP-dependent enzyme, partial [Acidobacteriota bacterium]|nr:aminotransferase class V-fold PLP-dependent enzyme [Acidobacteriota bacterium]
LWNTCANEGWDKPHLRAERFQRLGTCNLPALAGLRASIEFANNIGMDRIEKRQRALADHVLSEMLKRGVESWTSPDPSLRCAITTFNIPPLKCMDLETWLWKNHKIRIRGDVHSKVRISTPYYLAQTEIDKFLGRFDEYRAAHQRGGY